MLNDYWGGDPRLMKGFARIVAFASVALFLSVLGTSSGVSAQSEREELERARALMELGQDLYVQERYLESAAEFIAAYEVRQFSAFLYNAGIAYERQGDATHAIEYYDAYLEAEPNATDADDVRARLQRLRDALTALQPTDPDPVDPNNPDPTDPVDPNNPDPADPVDPNNPDPTDPVDPNNPDPTDPVDPNNPDPADPVDPNALPMIAAGPERAMKSMFSVETDPAGARITVRQGEAVVSVGPSPFNASLEAGEYQVAVEHPDFETITHELTIQPGKVYIAILQLRQGEFTGFLQVVSDPPGASIFMDEHEHGAMGQTPFQNVVGLGTHHIWIERPGYETIERDVEVSIGESTQVEVALERVQYGRILVTANIPTAEVFVDDSRVGTVPYVGDVDSGARTITVRADGMKDWEEEIEVERGQVTPIDVVLRPRPSRATAWTTAIFGLAAVGGGTALLFLGRGLETDLRADSLAGTLSSDDSRIQRSRFFTLGSYGAYGVGALMGVLSFVYFLRDGLPDSSGRVRMPRDWAFSPMIDRNIAGAALRGSF